MVQPLFSAADVKMLECKPVYQGYFQMQRIKLQYRLFAGGWSQSLFREVFVRGEAVGVLLFDPKQDQLVLIEQLRAGIVNQSPQPWLIEIVAGMIEPGEDKQAVAQRETQEETGLQLHNLYPITQYWLSPGGSNERMTLFCGQVDTSQAQGFHGLSSEGEDIRLHVIALSTAYAALERGEINNASTLIALLWLQQNEQKVRVAWTSNEKASEL